MPETPNTAACDGCGFTACPVLGQPCCDQCSHIPAPTAAREVAQFLWTWVVLMVLGSIPGLVIVALALGVRYVVSH